MTTGDEIRTIADILPAGSGRHPERVAVQEWDGERLCDTSYGELAAEVNEFASRLAESGLRARDRVAILMPNGKPWFVAYYAVMALGATAVPLEYEYLEHQSEHIAFALEHAEARAVVVMPQDVDRAGPASAGSPAQVLPFEGVGAASRALHRPDIDPSAVAQILYTSGTTGPKKGVVLTHANILFNVRACCARFQIGPKDCLPAVLPLHHAYPLTATVVLPLYGHARVAIGDIKSRTAPELLRAARPTVLVGVPRVFESLLSGIESAAKRQGALERLQRARAFSARVKRATAVNVGRFLFRRLHKRLFGGTQLRLCVSGGARLAPETVREYLKLGIPILQGWGMTETSPVGAVQPYSPARFYFTRHYERRAGSIGTPLEGTEISLIDVPGQDISVDRDGQGEMVVRGPHVMLEYYRDPEATERIKSSFGLRTGDVARCDRHGNYTIIGRAKHVIVLPGGKKVFPEEDLHEDLARCPSVDEFAVRAVRDAQGVETIGIIIRPNAELLRERGVATFGELYEMIKGEITEALSDRPDYMRRFDFCITELRDGEFCELVKSSMKDPCPLKNEFRSERSYSANRGSDAPLPVRPR